MPPKKKSSKTKNATSKPQIPSRVKAIAANLFTAMGIKSTKTTTKKKTRK